MQNLAQVLREWRFAQHLSVRDAAARVGLEASTYSRAERGLEVSAGTLRTVIFWLLAPETSEGKAQAGEEATDMQPPG